ncbi:DUF58 domain-containing protein [Halomonas denitrificans]|nr:DUF58 domain-containing protein [Halomonas denitrificans]
MNLSARLPGQWWRRWLARRLPAARRQDLTHRSVFILPTALGIGYMVLCGVLFIFGTNYQNNLILALCFLLISLFNTSLLLSFRNLAGLTVAGGEGHSRHAGDALPFDITLSSERAHYHLELRFPGGVNRYVSKVGPRAVTVQALHPPHRRGRLRPDRLVIASAYPLGLCRAWSRLDLDQSALVWPEPQAGGQLPVPRAREGDHQNRRHRAGVDDFHGLAPWQRGHSLARVAWKQAARSGEWQTKTFITPEGVPTELALDPALPLETGLSRLTHQLEQLHHRHQPYALCLGAQRYGPDSSEAHRRRCLNALACYPESL